MLEVLADTIRVAESSDQASLYRFDASLPDFLHALISGLRESEARLWGFKGNPTEWTDSRAMIKSGMRWDEDRRERLGLALRLETFRHCLTEALVELEAGRRTAEETRASTKADIESFCAGLADHGGHLEEEALAKGLVNQGQIAKLKKRADKGVGAVVRDATRETERADQGMLL